MKQKLEQTTSGSNAESQNSDATAPQFKATSKSLSFLSCKPLSELKITNNAKWSKGRMWISRLPQEVYLDYCYKDKKISFNINGGTERRSCINFQAEDKTVFDDLSLRLVNLGLEVSEETDIFSDSYSFDINNPDSKEFNTFICEIDKIYPLPKDIKETIYKYADTLNKSTEKNTTNFADLTDDLDKVKRELEILIGKVNLLEKTIKNHPDYENKQSQSSSFF